MTNRPRSLPPASTTTRVTRSSNANNPPSGNLIAVHRTSTRTSRSNPTSTAITATTTSSSHAPSRSVTVISAGSHLAAQAEALAKMTLEMHLRCVSKQASRLERDLQALVQTTKDDAAFRAQHEARLQDMWKEILAVKAHAAQDRDTRHLADAECRTETTRVMDEMRAELTGVKTMIGSLAATLAEMPSAEQMQAALSQSSDGDASRDRQEGLDQGPQRRSLSEPSSSSVHARIQDAVKSTRRWHRDHKTTRLSEGAFCAGYLRQQSKRDPQMALFLQRAVQRRVQARFPGRALRPRSLDEFCAVVRWEDVEAVVQDVLLRDTTDVVTALRG
ncbi:hypothetical protein ISF_00436 [Cordyceps fumosorosea ARSEF 2679]|uniref:Uncharacterized protein n=1 Tax=Cordyceps fumosorosea (strain ARSEF 2679) TaxID=1081104 RepID=A0A168E9D7_CORFA|nr:hypothetical protein ISF_00436 [Cordyceps fumosorosea ARSEF 2679]OAA73535.1 hypothetical protein ISF_00436 [Cordyceps fumosorosea ARSEF 2679]